MNLSISYFVMIAGILCAKCLGFVRESTVANNFGVSSVTDIYFQIFSVANVIFAAVGVSLSILVVKAFNAQKHSNERLFVTLFLKKVLKFAFIAFAVMGILGYPLTSLLLPGLKGNDFYTALKLYYIMLPSLIFIVLAYTLNGVLQNKGKFFITAILSVPFNILIIGSMLLGVKNIYIFGAVTTIGWASQFLFLLPSYFKNIKKGNDIGETEIFKNLNISELLFIFISNLVFQILFIIDKSFVSGNEGASSAIHYSSYLFTTVSGIFIAGMGAVFFPALTKSITEKKDEKTNSLIRYTLTFMFIIFAAFLMIVQLYNKNIISLLYERGSFTASDTIIVAGYFKIYAFCIFGYITQELLFKIFYAKGQYKITVISATVVIISNLICNFIFINNPVFISISTAFICCLFAVIMFFILHKQTDTLFNKNFFASIFKIVCTSLVFPVVFMLSKSFVSQSKILFVIPLGISSLIYLAVLWLWGPLKLIKNKC